MKISLSHLKAFSQCPAYYHYQKDSIVSVPTLLQKTVQDVIKKASLQLTETSYKSDWRKLVGWVDASIFADVDVLNQESFTAAKSLSEAALLGLTKWYNDYYLKEDHTCYIGLPLEMEIGDHVVYGEVPLIQVAEIPIVSTFVPVGLQKHEVYNDYYIRVLAMIVANELNVPTITMRSIGVGVKGGLDVSEYILNKDALDRTFKYTKQLVRAIAAGVDYPSRTIQCNECSFLRGCRI